MPYLQPASYELPFDSASETSRAAAERARDFVGRQGLEVLHWFQDQGAIGATQKEASAALGIDRPSMCARVHALEKRGDLVKTTERRDGCFVYRWFR
jgi:hypothetical protein